MSFFDAAHTIPIHLPHYVDLVSYLFTESRVV